MSRKVIAIAGGAIALVVVLAVALVVAIASSGDDDGDSEEPTPQTFQGSPPEGFEAPDAEELEEFRSCMEEQGVELPEPGGPPPSDIEGLQEAFEACRDLLPEGIGPPGQPGGQGPVIVPGG